MKMIEILNENFNLGKTYPDTKEGAIQCFVDVSIYKQGDITKVYPDPYVENVWAIHTKTKNHGSEKHVVYLEDHDFETDDRGGDEPFSVFGESATSGATSAGSIASVASVLGGGDVIRRSIYGDDTGTTKRKKKQPKTT